jgi:GNAT superfamily N-acetyltransferase
LPTNSSLERFAVTPAAFLPPAPGTHRIETARWLLSIGANDAVLTGLRFEREAAPSVLAEVRRRTEGTIFLSTDREDLALAFRELGFHDPTPLLAPTCTALATEREPPRQPGVEVRRIETFEDFRTGLEIELASFAFDRATADRRRADARTSYERRRKRPGGEWLAWLDGRAVGYGGAVAGPNGLYLSSGATLPEARGRGVYRALVHARWQEAVARGTPALVVHAQESSRPILERLGFRRICTIHELELDAC